MQELENQIKLITSNVEEVLPVDALKKKIKKSLSKKEALNIKFGVDPTAPDLHLGHALPLTKLRQFQDLGHIVTLIIGDFTARIGDPSGRNNMRPQLSVEAIKQNAKTYTNQAFKILDKKKTKVMFNSEWLKKLNFSDILNLSGKFTVARILERDDFAKRYKDNQPIGLHEFLYPLMQAYDSVEIKADIELGGTDQKFNMLAGRELQEKFEQDPQVVITMPILEGLDGVQKMSKSLNNHVGLSEPPEEIFGKVMSIPDSLMTKYFRLATGMPADDVAEIERGLKSGEYDPAQTKRKLARSIVKIYYSSKESTAAQEHFDRVFKEKKPPKDIPEVKISKTILAENGKVWIVKLLTEAGLASSNGEARRLIKGNAVKINGELINDENAELKVKEGDVLQAGKRKFVKIQF